MSSSDLVAREIALEIIATVTEAEKNHLDDYNHVLAEAHALGKMPPGEALEVRELPLSSAIVVVLSPADFDAYLDIEEIVCDDVDDPDSDSSKDHHGARSSTAMPSDVLTGKTDRAMLEVDPSIAESYSIYDAVEEARDRCERERGIRPSVIPLLSTDDLHLADARLIEAMERTRRPEDSFVRAWLSYRATCAGTTYEDFVATHRGRRAKGRSYTERDALAVAVAELRRMGVLAATLERLLDRCKRSVWMLHKRGTEILEAATEFQIKEAEAANETWGALTGRLILERQGK